jgi:hypothetical protein
MTTDQNDPTIRRNCLCYQHGRSPLDRATCAQQGHPALPGVSPAPAVGTERHVTPPGGGPTQADVDGVAVEQTKHASLDGQARIADMSDGRDEHGRTAPHASSPKGR